MLKIHHLLLYLISITSIAFAAKYTTYRPKQCLRYRENDIFLETCPAYSTSTEDFSVALFPDPAVISGLSKPNNIEKHNLDISKVAEPSKSSTVTTEESAQSTTHIDESHLDHQVDATNSRTIDDSNTRDSVEKDSKQQTSTQSQEEEERDDRTKPLVSFEEWQKKAIQENDKDRRHKRKTAEGGIGGSVGKTSGNKRQQMVDSIDGGFSDDFGSMFEDLIGDVVGKQKTPNVYDEGEYIAPSKSGQGDGNKKLQQFAAVRMKSLKERFNYASTDCAATVRKSNKQAKGAQSILYESKDQYLLNKCSADKFVIINLCEQIVVDTLVMANFEFFSSTFKDFRVYASSKYPTNDWRLLGQWQARNTRDLQVFKVPDSGFVEYVKIEFLTHYGHEYYCPLSLVRVHGMSNMEYYTTVESQGDNPIIEEEHLWPAEVREQLIQPQSVDVANASESFPTKNEVEEDDIKPIIPPINFDIVNVDPSPIPGIEIHDSGLDLTTETLDKDNREHASSTITNEIEGSHVVSDIEVLNHIGENKASMDNSTAPSHEVTVEATSSSQSPSSSTSSPSVSIASTNEGAIITQEEASTAHSNIPPTTDSKSPTSSSHASKSNDEDPSPIVSSNTNSNHQNVNSTHTSTATTVTATSEDSKPIIPPPPQKVAGAVNYPKEGSTQESIYKTIMKRLNVLEGNMTLSLRYLDEQNKNLNDVLKDMERKHQEQLIQLIGHLNDTASLRIDSMKRRYEQWYEDLKDQTDSDMRELTAKISILSEQLSFERRVSVSQLVIMITLFVFMALSRGTFSTLSPVMAAQQEERKRRESIDQSSTLSKESMDVISNTSKSNGAANTSNTTLASVSASAKNTSTSTMTEEVKSKSKISETPKKPNNPRRHSDNLYHIMTESEINLPAARSRGSSNANESHNTPPKNLSINTNYEALGIELQNEVLQKKLGDVLLQQQQKEKEEQEQEVPLLNNVSRKASLDNLEKQQTKMNEASVHNRKRSSTSPSAIE